MGSSPHGLNKADGRGAGSNRGPESSPNVTTGLSPRPRAAPPRSTFAGTSVKVGAQPRPPPAVNDLLLPLLFITAIAAVVWLVNRVVALLSGEPPRDTARDVAEEITGGLSELHPTRPAPGGTRRLLFFTLALVVAGTTFHGWHRWAVCPLYAVVSDGAPEPRLVEQRVAPEEIPAFAELLARHGQHHVVTPSGIRITPALYFDRELLWNYTSKARQR